MPIASDLMSTHVQVVEPQETLQRAAQLMRELDVGSLPVCTGRRLVGMVTDRDIAVRGVAAGLAPGHGCVSDVMSPRAACCTVDQDALELMRMMGDYQLRRLPVVNADRELVGIVSLGDLALSESSSIGQTVRRISELGSANDADRTAPADDVPRRPSEYR